jgi:DNA-binding CsgD family transcriptional regulator
MENSDNDFERNDSVVSCFYEGIPEINAVKEDENLQFYIECLASMSVESVYVIDFEKKCFNFVSNHSLFLCGHSQQEALRMGYDFYSDIIFPADLPRFIKIHRAILNRLLIADNDVYKINFFAFTLKIKEYPQFGRKKKYVTVYHKVKPIFVNRQIRYGICMLNISVVNRSLDNLRVYYNDQFFEEYSNKNCKWERYKLEYLTEQELIIVKLAMQGLSDKEIADECCMSCGSIKNIITKLLKKLRVKSMLQAVNIVTNNLMIFYSVGMDKDIRKTKLKKRDYSVLTPERIEYFQKCLDNGQSISLIAKRGKISRTTVYRLIKSGKLTYSKEKNEKKHEIYLQ